MNRFRNLLSTTKTGAFMAAIALVGSVVPPCQAQDTPERQIDTSLLTPNTITLRCDISTYSQASDCARRLVPTISYRISHYIARETTFLLRVTYGEFPDPNNGNKPTVSSGSAFLVDRENGYFLTAKHVLLGSKVWSTHFSPSHGFADLETAIEDYLYSEKVEITVQSDEDDTRIPAKLIALDRGSDLALLKVTGLKLIAISNYPALFRSLALADDLHCSGSMSVSAVGFTTGPNPRKMERQATEFSEATCDLFPRTYLIGGQKYRIALFPTKTGFKPGFSGGPVLDSEFRVVGVVSGATPQGDNSTRYFVPLPAVRSFLARFR